MTITGPGVKRIANLAKGFANIAIAMAVAGEWRELKSRK